MLEELNSTKRYYNKRIYKRFATEHSRSLARHYIKNRYKLILVTDTQITVTYWETSNIEDCDELLQKTKKGDVFISYFRFCFKRTFNSPKKNILCLPRTFSNMIFFKIVKKRDICNVLLQMIRFLKAFLNKDCTKLIFEFILF